MEAGVTWRLPKTHRKILLALAKLGPMTAREIALDVDRDEATTRKVLWRLGDEGFTDSWDNGYGVLRHCITALGRERAAQLDQQRVAVAAQEAVLAAADPATIVLCPECHGERRFCATCRGCRSVTEAQAAARVELQRAQG